MSDPAPSLGELRSFCQFLGWSRSGTSLVGALLDAHPRVLIAQELDAAALIAGGTSRELLLRALVDKEAEFGRAGRSWNGYSYAVPGAAQDRGESPLVIGDKKAGGTAEVLMQRPGLVAETEALLRLRLRFVTVARNPFDTVATLARHLDTDLPPWAERRGDELETAVDWYLRIAAIVERVRAEVPEQTHLIHLERLIAEPRAELRRLFGFVGVDAHEDTIAACAEVVFERRRATGEGIAWPSRERELLEAALERHEFLAPYRAGALA